MAQWHHMVTKKGVSIESGNGSLSDGAKPLPDPMLTNRQWGLVPKAISREVFKVSILDKCMSIKISNSRLQMNFPGANELNRSVYMWSMIHKRLRGCFHMITSSNGNIFRVTGLCVGNSPVTDDFPAQRPVTRSFDVFFDLHLDKRLSKQSWGWWFETPSRSSWRHCNSGKAFYTIAICLYIIMHWVGQS